MTEADESQLPEPPDADVTIATPRFDATETQVAQPVVPLADVRARRRIWPLLLLSAILGSAVSLFGFYLYERQSARTSGAQPAAERQAAQPEPSAPAAAETAQVAAPPADTHAATATSDAVPAAAELKTDARATARATSDASRAARTRRSEPTEEHRVAAARRPAPAIDERATHTTRPRTVTTRTPPRARNVDRIRDIFEGTPPPV